MNADSPEGQEAAVIQALMVRAKYGQVQMSERQIAKATNLSRSCVHRTLVRLTKSAQVTVKEPANHLNPTLWEIAGQGVVQGVVHEPDSIAGNRVPTMPFNYPPPTGEEGSWFEQVCRAITRAKSSMMHGTKTADCRTCADVGYHIEPTSVEFSRDWLKVCHCQAGEGKTIPDLGEYEPEREIGMCLMCGNSGWVTIATGQVQRCYSCNRTGGY